MPRLSRPSWQRCQILSTLYISLRRSLLSPSLTFLLLKDLFCASSKLVKRRSACTARTAGTARNARTACRWLTQVEVVVTLVAQHQREAQASANLPAVCEEQRIQPIWEEGNEDTNVEFADSV